MSKKRVKGKSKLRNIAKKVVICGAFAGFLNYFGLPIGTYVSSTFSKKDIKNRRIQQVCRTDSCLEDIMANIDVKNCDVLPFVKVAHALAARHLTYERVHYKEMKRALEEGRGDCVVYSIFTHGNFLYLTDKFKRPDLKDKVRSCLGFYSGNGHAWLQVYFNNKWNDYETTFDPLRTNDNINFKWINLLFPDNRTVSIDDKYDSFSYVRFENGELNTYGNPLASIKSGISSFKAFLKFIRKS